MKRLTLLLSLLACMTAGAQTHLRIWQQGESDRKNIAEIGDLTFSGSNVDIKGTTYALADIDSIIIVPEITVTYNGTTATVSVPDNAKDYVTYTVDGANVTVTNTNVDNEMEFVLSGSSSDGSFTYNGSFKCTIELNGLDLTSTTGAAIDIECGKRIDLDIADGTTNTLVDAANGAQKACLYTKGHLEISGSGTLNVTGNTAHAISAKEYMLLKKSTGTINIVSAMKNGLNTNEQFEMRGGVVTMETSSEDSKVIKADSLISIYGGTLNATLTANGSRGIQTDTDMVINESYGTTTLNITGTGTYCTLEECSLDPHRPMGIKVDGNLTIEAGTVTANLTGKGSRGIKVGGTYYKYGGTVTASSIVATATVTN